MKNFQEVERTFNRLVEEGKMGTARGYIRNYLTTHSDQRDPKNQGARRLLEDLEQRLALKSPLQRSEGPIQAFEGMPTF